MDNGPDNVHEHAGMARPRPARALLDVAVARLNAHEGVLARLLDADPAILQLQYGATQTELKVIGHPDPPPAPDAVLVRRHITNKYGKLLKKQNINYMDTAGNVYVQGPNFLLWVTGQPRNREHLNALPEEPPVARPPDGRAFEPKGLRVIFTLLCRPEYAARPYREIAALAGTAHGTVGHVIQDLEALGFIVPGPARPGGTRGRRRLVKIAPLLEQWARIFVRTLRPRQLIGRYRGRPLDELATVRWADHGALPGGEFAADAVTAHLRPGTLTLHLQEEKPTAGLLRELRLQPDPRGNIELLKKFWTFDTHDAERPDLAPLPLVYADLLAIDDARCEETARLLLANITGTAVR